MAKDEKTKALKRKAAEAFADAREEHTKLLEKIIQGKLDGYDQAVQAKLAKLDEQIQTFNALNEAMQARQAAGAEQGMNLSAVQKNVLACMRGECRRLQGNINEMRVEQNRQGQIVGMLTQPPPQNPLPQPPQQRFIDCSICHNQVPVGAYQCPYCSVIYDWS